MPTWLGRDFLDNFEKLDKQIMRQIKIYIMSSSVDPDDHKRARDNRHGIGYIKKPLSELNVLSAPGPHGFLKQLVSCLQPL
jgi:hypothetical protein